MRPLAGAVVLSGVLLSAASLTAPKTADEIRGKQLFERRCGGCHSLDKVKEGPRLQGVYGRRAGSTADFQYSDALKSSKFTWSGTTLEKWLTDTESLVPDNDMTFRVPNPDERHAIIAYLETLSQ